MMKDRFVVIGSTTYKLTLLAWMHHLYNNIWPQWYTDVALSELRFVVLLHESPPPPPSPPGPASSCHCQVVPLSPPGSLPLDRAQGAGRPCWHGTSTQRARVDPTVPRVVADRDPALFKLLLLFKHDVQIGAINVSLVIIMMAAVNWN